VPKIILPVVNNKIRNYLFAIGCIAFLIRIAFGVVTYINNGTSNFIDEWDYISYANNIIIQGIWVPDISKFYSNSYIVGPAFPLILAIIFNLFGENYILVIILNAILSSITCVLIYFLAKTIFSEKAGLLASVWSIFYVNFIVYVPRLLKEVWLPFLIVLIVYLFIIETKKFNIGVSSFILPILFSFLIHMDERFFIYFPVLILSFLFLDELNIKSGLNKAVLFTSIVLLSMIPWLLRNYHVYERPVILTERTASFTDKIFNYEIENKNGRRTLNSFKKSGFVWKESMIDEIINGNKVDGLTGIKGDGIPGPIEERHLGPLRIALINGYVPEDRSIYTVFWTRFVEFWRPVSFGYGSIGWNPLKVYEPWSFRHNLTVGLTYGLLLPFLIIGIYFVLKKVNKYAIFLILVICLYTFIHVFLIGVTNRYRIPVDPFVIILAMYGFTESFDIVKSKIKPLLT